MKVLVTGHDGYIGCVLTPLLQEAGHEVVGLDSGLYAECRFGDVPQVEALGLDVRDVGPQHLEGFDAVMHLAALSNDPVGDLNPDLTYAVNHRASVDLARSAKAAGVPRFLFSSSCSLYGAAEGADALDEGAAFNPVTPYGESKVLAEQGIAPLADDAFSPTFLRNATAYGVSPRMRGDLVVNQLAAFAYTTGEITMASDGSPWRPLVHIEDISRAFLAILEAPREAVHGEAFNVGRDSENYQIRDVANLVGEALPEARITFAEGASPDKRSYKVSFGKLADRLPELQMEWTVRRGVDECLEAYERAGITYDEFMSSRFLRIKRIRELLEAQRLDADLRWRAAVAA